MQLAKELSLKEEQVRKTVELIDEGCTIPFIARYRKEVTGSLDDTVLRALEERLTYLRNLQKRKDEVAKAITDLGLMTDEIFAALEEAQILTEVEDIYRPFKPKRKTRASVAREKGLAPLAQLLLEQDPGTDPEKEAAAYIHEEKGVLSVEEALQGAQDILAEDISDNAEYGRRPASDLPLRQSALQAGQGGGFGLCQLLRLLLPPEGSARTPDSGDQSGREGGIPQGFGGNFQGSALELPLQSGGEGPSDSFCQNCNQGADRRLRPVDRPLGGAGNPDRAV